MIYAGIDVENFANFDSAEQVLAYAGFEPSVDQSGQMVFIWQRNVLRVKHTTYLYHMLPRN